MTKRTIKGLPQHGAISIINSFLPEPIKIKVDIPISQPKIIQGTDKPSTDTRTRSEIERDHRNFGWPGLGEAVYSKHKGLIPAIFEATALPIAIAGISTAAVPTVTAAATGTIGSVLAPYTVKPITSFIDDDDNKHMVNNAASYIGGFAGGFISGKATNNVTIKDITHQTKELALDTKSIANAIHKSRKPISIDIDPKTTKVETGSESRVYISDKEPNVIKERINTQAKTKIDLIKSVLQHDRTKRIPYMVQEKYIGYTKDGEKYVPIYKQKQLSHDDITRSYFDGYEVQDAELNKLGIRKLNFDEIQKVPGAMKVLEDPIDPEHTIYAFQGMPLYSGIEGYPQSHVYTDGRYYYIDMRPGNFAVSKSPSGNLTIQYMDGNRIKVNATKIDDFDFDSNTNKFNPDYGKWQFYKENWNRKLDWNE